eukprot:6456908-Amphidinium_carterae.1
MKQTGVPNIIGARENRRTNKQIKSPLDSYGFGRVWVGRLLACTAAKREQEDARRKAEEDARKARAAREAKDARARAWARQMVRK